MKIPPKIHVLKIFDNKSVMTGHGENNNFCFPETLNVLRGKVNSSNSKTRKDSEKNELLDAYAIAYTSCARQIEWLPKPSDPIEKSR